MTHDTHDLVGAYCTDALDPAERERFESHLAECPACRAEAATTFEALALMAAAHAVPPPPHLEDAIVDAARAALPPAQGAPSGPQVPTAEGSVPGDAPGAQGTRAATWHRAALWFAAAAAGALLFAGGVVVGSRSAVDPVADDMTTLVAVASAPDAHFLTMDIMGTQSRVVMSGEMDKSALVASDLPKPAKGMCYQVWRVTTDGSMESAGVFIPDEDGHIAVALTGPARDVVKFVITIEPPGGSEHPTGEMLSEVST